MKNGPQIPSWAAGVAIAVVAVVAIIVGLRFIQGEGPRDPSTYPKSAYQVPDYGSYDRAKSTGGSPSGSSARP